MNRYYSYIASATNIIQTYVAGKPLSVHLRSFFAADKKFGSKDRKIISSLCYYYFRTGGALAKNTVEEKILAGLFLCENKSHALLQFFRPELNEQIELPLTEKLHLLDINETMMFRLDNELSPEINKPLFVHSFLKQPLLYLRIRPGKKTTVIHQLQNVPIDFELAGDDCLILPNNIGADKFLELNKEVVVQDFNSQKVLDYLSTGEYFSTDKKIPAWDCCAASGGKSILLHDKMKGNIELTVSDIRENILINLQKRLKQAGVPVSSSFIADLSVVSGLDTGKNFSIIICDAPCTGSGTWSRSPEQLYHFNRKKIAEYSGRQQKIVSHTIPHLKKEGLFFYITCSVFTKENESIVAFIEEKFQLQLLKMEYLKGYENFADTMFLSVFKRN